MRLAVAIIGGLMMAVLVVFLDALKATPPYPNDDDFEALEVPCLEEASMTVPEAGESLGLGAEQVRRLLRADRLAGVPMDGRTGWLVSRRSVERLLRERHWQ